MQDAPFRRKEGGSFAEEKQLRGGRSEKCARRSRNQNLAQEVEKNVFSDDIQRSAGDCQSVFAALYRLESIKRGPVADHQVPRRRHSQDGQRSGSGESRSLLAPTHFAPGAVNVLSLVSLFLFLFLFVFSTI